MALRHWDRDQPHRSVRAILIFLRFLLLSTGCLYLLRVEIIALPCFYILTYISHNIYFMALRIQSLQVWTPVISTLYSGFMGWLLP